MKSDVNFIDGKLILQQNENKNDDIKMLFVGDFCPINKSEKLILDGKSNDIIASFVDDFYDRDIAIINMEAPLSNSGMPIKKTGPNLRVDPGCVDFLKTAKFDVASLANNHIGDYGPEPVLETMRVLDDNNIMHVGAGKDLNSSRIPLLFNKNGLRIAILSFAEYEFGIAEANKAGACPLEPLSNIHDIKAVAQKADIIIVLIHGGNEECPVPSPRMVQTYRAFVDAGASVVVGTHTHCPQGIEIYNGAPIIYNIGNFLFDTPYSGEGFKEESFWWKSYMVKISFSENNASLIEVIPYTFGPDATRISHLPAQDKIEFIKYLEHISSIIQNEEELQDLWYGWCALKGPFWFNYFSNAKYPAENNEADYFNTMVLRNGFTCAAHHEVAKTFLRMICEGKVELGIKQSEKIRILQRGMILKEK